MQDSRKSVLPPESIPSAGWNQRCCHSSLKFPPSPPQGHQFLCHPIVFEHFALRTLLHHFGLWGHLGFQGLLLLFAQAGCPDFLSLAEQLQRLQHHHHHLLYRQLFDEQHVLWPKRIIVWLSFWSKFDSLDRSSWSVIFCISNRGFPDFNKEYAIGWLNAFPGKHYFPAKLASTCTQTSSQLVKGITTTPGYRWLQ